MANVSSLITLKSDLIKRKAEARSHFESKHSSLDLYSFNQISRKCNKFTKICNKSVVLPQKSNDLEYKKTMDNLEKKSQLYDKLVDNISIENEFLVDFTKKDNNPMCSTKQDETLNSSLNEDNEINYYTKVLNTEIRDHGTGYFKFSFDISKRKQQMEELKKFQEEVNKEKYNFNKIHEMENSKLESRLKKIKNKYKVNVAHEDLIPKLQAAEDSEDTSKEISESITINDLLFEIRKNTQIKSKRAWDRGKKPIFDNIKKRLREDRDENFAPPKYY